MVRILVYLCKCFGRILVYFISRIQIIDKSNERSELMGKKRKGKANSDSIQKHTPNGENEKRLNQVPNSKNPQVPGNQAPY